MAELNSLGGSVAEASRERQVFVLYHFFHVIFQLPLISVSAVKCVSIKSLYYSGLGNLKSWYDPQTPGNLL